MGSVMTTVLASNQPTRSRSNAVSHQKNTTAAVCNGGGATCTTCIAQRWEQKQQNRKYPRNQDPINVFRTNLASTRRRLPRTRSNGGETRTRSNAISYQDNAYRKDPKNVRTRRRLPRSRSNAIDETSSLYPCADCGKVNLTRNAYESYNDADRIFAAMRTASPSFAKIFATTVSLTKSIIEDMIVTHLILMMHYLRIMIQTEMS